jgi:hypothetical protein
MPLSVFLSPFASEKENPRINGVGKTAGTHAMRRRELARLRRCIVSDARARLQSEGSANYTYNAHVPWHFAQPSSQVPLDWMAIKYVFTQIN